MHENICHFARAVKGVDLKSTAVTRVGSSPAGDVDESLLLSSLVIAAGITDIYVCDVMYT